MCQSSFQENLKGFTLCKFVFFFSYCRALGVPVLDYTYDDCKLMTKAKEMNLPCATQLVEVRKLRHKLGYFPKYFLYQSNKLIQLTFSLDNLNVEENFITDNFTCKDCSKITYTDFVKYLNIPSNDTASQQLFKIYDKV